MQEKLSEASDYAISKDPKFWVIVHNMVQLLRPIADAILYLQSDEPRISHVYKFVKEIESSFSKMFLANEFPEAETTINTLFFSRKKQIISPIHLAAYLLDPKFKGKGLTNDEYTAAITKITSRAEILIQGFQSGEAMVQLKDYLNGSGAFGMKLARSNIHKMDPVNWWACCFRNHELTKIAVEILGMHPTSASVERCFSKFGFLHSVRRNKLTFEKSSKLTYISYNNKVLEIPGEAERFYNRHEEADTSSVLSGLECDIPFEDENFQNFDQQNGNATIL